VQYLDLHTKMLARFSSHMFTYPPSANGAGMMTPPKFAFPPHNGIGQLTSLAAKYGKCPRPHGISLCSREKAPYDLLS